MGVFFTKSDIAARVGNCPIPLQPPHKGFLLSVTISPSWVWLNNTSFFFQWQDFMHISLGLLQNFTLATWTCESQHNIYMDIFTINQCLGAWKNQVVMITLNDEVFICPHVVKHIIKCPSDTDIKQYIQHGFKMEISKEWKRIFSYNSGIFLTIIFLTLKGSQLEKAGLKPHYVN